VEADAGRQRVKVKIGGPLNPPKRDLKKQGVWGAMLEDRRYKPETKTSSQP